MRKKQVYHCGRCGNLVEALWEGPIGVACCGLAMQELVPGATDASKEKHVPAVERRGDRVLVKVGAVAHPMTAEHYILFVEVLAGDQVLRQDFKVGDTAAAAEFTVPAGLPVTARAYCNLHGFWSATA